MAYAFTRRLGTAYDVNTWVAQWAELTDAQTDPEYISVPNHTDVTVQVLNLHSTTPTMIVEGSLNLPEDTSKVWFPLTVADGTAISFTALGGKEVLQSCMLIRPRVTVAGTITCRIKATKSFPGH